MHNIDDKIDNPEDVIICNECNLTANSEIEFHKQFHNNDIYQKENFIDIIGHIILGIVFLIIIVEGLIKQYERKTWLVLGIFIIVLMMFGFSWIYKNTFNKRFIKLQRQIDQLKNSKKYFHKNK